MQKFIVMLDYSQKITGLGLTFEDVLLLPAHSQVLPREVNTASQLTTDIRINLPILSAAMDTVTEFRLAIAMAAEGGLGILHKNMTIEEQAEQVRRVKRSESGMILDPICLQETATVADAFHIMERHKIGGIPVIDKNNKLVGIITNRDLRFQKPSAESVTKHMTSNGLITAPQGTNLETAEAILRKYKVEKLPVVNDNGTLVGLITYKDILKKQFFPNACKDEYGRLRVGAAVGITNNTMERIQALVNASVDLITIDTAHGHSQGVLDMVKEIRQEFPSLQIIAGNIGTRSAAEDLIKTGVNAVKVGIGPGSICTTRIVTGVGIPQITAIMEVASVAKEAGVPVIADGGVKQTGDIPKAIVAGADVIMAGNLFAGTEESPGETIIYQGRKFKSYRGMGSISAMKKGSKDRYFQDVEDDVKKLVPEGIEGRVPYKGKVSEVLYQLAGGLKASMGYCGAKDINELKNAKFVQITQAGFSESHPHSISITKESPNYWSRN